MSKHTHFQPLAARISASLGLSSACHELPVYPEQSDLVFSGDSRALVANGLVNGLVNGIPRGLPSGLPNALPNGLPGHLPDGVADTLVDGVALGLSDEFAAFWDQSIDDCVTRSIALSSNDPKPTDGDVRPDCEAWWEIFVTKFALIVFARDEVWSFTHKGKSYFLTGKLGQGDYLRDGNGTLTLAEKRRVSALIPLFITSEDYFLEEFLPIGPNQLTVNGCDPEDIPAMADAHVYIGDDPFLESAGTTGVAPATNWFDNIGTASEPLYATTIGSWLVYRGACLGTFRRAGWAQGDYPSSWNCVKLGDHYTPRLVNTGCNARTHIGVADRPDEWVESSNLW